MGLQVHLVDGTYELFRYHYSPANKDPVRGATRGVVGSCLMLLEQGATHVAVATDHVIESFRNDLWAGLQGRLRASTATCGRSSRSWRTRCARPGFPVWAMVEQEADDALAAGAAVAAADDAVERVVICTPDKDLGQCVGGKVWQWDRRQDKWFDAAGVRERLGVLPRLDPRPPRPRGRRRRRLPRAAGLGRQVGRRRARPVGPPRGHPARPARPGTPACAAPPSSTPPCASSSSWRCCSAASPPWRPTPTSARSPTGSGPGPTDDFPAVVAALGDDRLLARAARLVDRLGRPEIWRCTAGPGPVRQRQNPASGRPPRRGGPRAPGPRGGRGRRAAVPRSGGRRRRPGRRTSRLAR